MNTIEPFRKTSNLVSRQSARLEAETGLDLQRLGNQAQLQAAKVHGVSHVARTANFEIAMLSLAEQTLAQAVPLASGRLAAIGDIAGLAFCEVVAETAHTFGRV